MASRSVTGVSGLSLRKYRTTQQKSTSDPGLGWCQHHPSGFSAMKLLVYALTVSAPCASGLPAAVSRSPSVSVDTISAALGGKSRFFSAKDMVQIKV